MDAATLSTPVIKFSSSFGGSHIIAPSSLIWKALTPPVYQVKGKRCRSQIGGTHSAKESQIAAENISKGEMSKVKQDSLITHIRWMLSTFEDGRISISPYDTAWVSLIENADATGTPQFPSSLHWIAANQLPDGSWGDPRAFSIYDRLLNTLASVIALTSWSVHPHKSEKGIQFLQKNSKKLENPQLDSITCGFEVIFPPLMERARKLGIEILWNEPFVTSLVALREKKLSRIPREHMMEAATPIIYNLEGISEGLNWEKLLKLQTEEGSFLTSPSATAFAFMQTGNAKCFDYLHNIVTKFNGGAPTVYPIDLFARLWAVDRLQRLGISHLFKDQILECLTYVYGYWTANGVFSGRKATVCDLDDTSMGFRLLRLEGFNISPDVFKYFKSDDGKFICLGGELNASPTTLLNLYKASQVRFSGEKVLEDAENFSYNYLKEKVSLDVEIVDKWILSKDIAGEIKFGVRFPFFACLPRVEARFYMEQYSGADDVWIGKTFYRVEEISNNHYLELAKSEYSECRTQHLLEWANILVWWKKSKLDEYGLRREKLLLIFFLASATVFEVNRSAERCGWAKSWAIIHVIGIYFEQIATSRDKRSAFLATFKGHTGCSHHKMDEQGMGKSILCIIQEFIYQQSIDTFQDLGRDIRQQLTSMWETWLEEAVQLEAPNEGAFLAQILNLCAGNVTQLNSNDEDYKYLYHITNEVCLQLRQYKEKQETSTAKQERNINCAKIETNMQELLRMVVHFKSPEMMNNISQAFFDVAKAFYYIAYCDQETINLHISKVLFDPLV